MPILPSSTSDQDGGAGDRLGLRGDAEDGVGRHAAAGLLVAPAEGALVHGLAVAQHEGHRAGNAVILGILLQNTVNALKAFLRNCRLAKSERRAQRAEKKGSIKYLSADGIMSPNQSEFRISLGWISYGPAHEYHEPTAVQWPHMFYGTDEGLRLRRGPIHAFHNRP